MPTVLNEMNFELLLPGEDTGIVFGIGQHVSIDDEGFDPGEDSWVAEDERNPRLGGTNFGRETLDGPLWGFQLHVDRESVDTARETLEDFKTAWRATQVRDNPNAVLTMRYRIGRHTRRVYGRPRRLAAPPSNRILNGFVPITTDFQCSTQYTYDDVEKSETLQIAASTPSGFTFPITFPYSSTPARRESRQLVVGGTEPARPVITFTGPLQNPVLEGPGWRLQMQVSILANESLTVDLRPWEMTVKMSDGRSVPDAVHRQTRLTDVMLPPGRHQVFLSGASTTASGACTVRWADTWNSI